MASAARSVLASSLNARGLHLRSYIRHKPLLPKCRVTIAGARLKSLWHHPRCKWVRHVGPIQSAPRDKNCQACQDEEAGPHQLSQRELLWRRQMQQMHAILERDPYEALFGFSNRLLRGEPFPYPTTNSTAFPWWHGGEALTSETVSRSGAKPSKLEPQPDVKHYASQKDTSPSTLPNGTISIPAQQAGEPHEVFVPIVKHTAIVRDSLHISAQMNVPTREELQFDPISMRMVPKPLPSMNTAIQTQAPSNIIKAEKDTTTRAVVFTNDLQQSPDSTVKSGAKDPKPCGHVDTLAESTPGTPENGAKSDSATLSWRQKPSGSSAPVTFSRDTKPAGTANGGARQFDLDSCNAKDCIDDYNFEVLKANSATPAGRGAALRYCTRSVDSLDLCISQSRGVLALLTSSRASNLQGKSDLLHFLAAKVRSDSKMIKKTRELLDHLRETKSAHPWISSHKHRVIDGGRITEISKTRKQLEQSWTHDIGTKASTTVEGELLKNPSWSSGPKYDAEGVSSRKATPEKQWKEKVPSKVLKFPLVEKEKPLAHMSLSEIEQHRKKLLDSWTNNHAKMVVKDTDKLLSLEIEAQKAAMAAYESRRAQRSDGRTTHLLEAVVPGEGDICSNAPKFAQSGRWYKRPAPHALMANEEQRIDQTLVNDIRTIYENAYGKIEKDHVQGESNINSNEHVTTKSNVRRRDTTLYKVLAFDPSNQSIYTANATSTYTPPTGEKCLAVSDALARLQAPAKFIPLLAEHQENGYEIVSASKHLLVLKRVRADSASDIVPKPDSSRPRFSSSINPIDPTIQTLKMPTPAPQVGNFASPTGFVNHDYPYHAQAAPQRPLTNSEVASQSAASPSPIVRKEEAVFSGSQSPQSRAWQAEFDKAYRRELRRSAKRAARAEHRSDLSDGRTDIPQRFASNWFKDYDGHSRHRYFPDKATISRTDFSNGRPTSRSIGFWRRFKRVLRRMVLLFGWTAACAYAAGVVMEYFRTGGSVDRDERGWGQDAKQTQKKCSLPSIPEER